MCNKERLYKLCSRIVRRIIYTYIHHQKIQNFARRSETLSNSRSSLITNNRNIICRERTIFCIDVFQLTFDTERQPRLISDVERANKYLASRPPDRIRTETPSRDDVRKSYRASPRDFSKGTLS